MENEVKILKENIEDLKILNQEMRENMNQVQLENNDKDKEIMMLMEEIKRLGSEAELSKTNKIS